MASNQPEIIIRPLAPGEDSTPFRTLNEEWITRLFTLEPKDREMLNDPESMILSKGGRLLMVYARERAVGCVALIPMGNGVYELSKMAVSPELRGMGIGRRLLLYAIEQAKEMGARTLVLDTSTKLQNAIHLYESLGFQHIPPEQFPRKGFARADVFMKMSF